MDRIDKFHAPLFARTKGFFTSAAGFRFLLLALALLGGAPALPEERRMFSQACNNLGQHYFN